MSFNSGMKGADVVALLKNGLPIVDDVNKLDPNAELGSVASVVTYDGIQETSTRNLYQPDASILDVDAGILTAPELLSSVSSIKVFAPTDDDNIVIVNSCFYLVPRDFSMVDETLATVQVDNGNVFAITMVGGMDTQQNFVLVEYSSDTDSFIVHDDQVEAFNAVLANGRDWCYLGCPDTGFVITEEQFNTVDLFVNAVVGMPSSTAIYVKGDKWELPHKKDLEKLAKGLEAYKKVCEESIKSVSESKANKILFNVYNQGYGLHPNLYTSHNVSTTGSVSIKLADIEDATVYSEYILELKCTSTPSSVSFTDKNGTALDIKWSNDVAPIFKAGFTYMISIVNGFGVYSTFINK